MFFRRQFITMLLSPSLLEFICLVHAVAAQFPRLSTACLLCYIRIKNDINNFKKHHLLLLSSNLQFVVVFFSGLKTTSASHILTSTVQMLW